MVQRRSKKAPDSASQDLAAIIRRLNPNVPAGSDDNAIPRTDRDSNAMRQLRAHLAADPAAKLLLAGHIGVGKSTELVHLGREMAADRHVVACSIAQTLGVHNVETFTLLIVILEAALRSWISALPNIPPGLVEELVRHIHTLFPPERRPLTETPLQKALGLGNAVEAMTAAAGGRQRRVTTGHQLLNLYSEILQRLALRFVPLGELAAVDTSSIALSCELVIKEMSHLSNKPVLLIIDDLDKVRDDAVQADIFVDRAMTWMRLPCSVVATLPLEAIFSPRGRDIDNIWGEVQILDPLPVPDAAGEGTADPALQPYLQMLRSADAQTVFTALQCRKLAHVSSGLPRTFIYACSSCVRYALEASEAHVRDYHIDLVQRALIDRWRGRLNDSDYQALIAVLDSGGANVPRAIQSLRDGLLIRDGSASGDMQFRIANWMVPLLEVYRMRHPSSKH